jgi:flagellar export protein FliJ
MKRFKFALESVLQLRARAEIEAQQHHAAAGRALDEAKAEFSVAESEWKQLVAQLGELQGSTFVPAERHIIWNATNQKKDECKALAQKVELAARELDVKRQALLAARRDHEAMLKLREKQPLEHSMAAERSDRALIDDVINARHVARRLNPNEVAL